MLDDLPQALRADIFRALDAKELALRSGDVSEMRAARPALERALAGVRKWQGERNTVALIRSAQRSADAARALDKTVGHIHGPR
jgi:hypothetical protein